MNISRVIFKTAIPSDINDKISRMINQALLYRRTGSKLIDNATRAVEIAVEQSESVATTWLHKQLSGNYNSVILESFYGNAGLKVAEEEFELK